MESDACLAINKGTRGYTTGKNERGVPGSSVARLKLLSTTMKFKGTRSDGPEATTREDGHSMQLSVACALFDVGQEDISVQVSISLAVTQYLLSSFPKMHLYGVRI